MCNQECNYYNIMFHHFVLSLQVTLYITSKQLAYCIYSVHFVNPRRFFWGVYSASYNNYIILHCCYDHWFLGIDSLIWPETMKPTTMWCGWSGLRDTCMLHALVVVDFKMLILVRVYTVGLCNIIYCDIFLIFLIRYFAVCYYGNCYSIIGYT